MIWIILGILLIFFLIGISAFFSMSEMAFVSLNRAVIIDKANKGDKRAITLAKLIKQPDNVISAIVIGNNLVNIFASVIAGAIATIFFGNIGIGIKDKEGKQAEIGWLLANHYQGMGIATEAAGAVISLGFDVLGLHRIYARTGKTNTKSWCLMERLGMRQEAHFRKSHAVKGNWDDEFIYAILAEEWRKQSRKNTS